MHTSESSLNATYPQSQPPSCIGQSPWSNASNLTLSDEYSPISAAIDHDLALNPRELSRHRSTQSLGHRYTASNSTVQMVLSNPREHSPPRSTQSLGHRHTSSDSTVQMGPFPPLYLHHSNSTSSLLRTRVATQAMVEANARRRVHQPQFECECGQRFTAQFSLKREFSNKVLLLSPFYRRLLRSPAVAYGRTPICLRYPWMWPEVLQQQ